MNRKERIALEIEKTLSLLDSPERFSSDPYFVTRFRARLRSEEGSASASFSAAGFAIRTVFALGLLAANLLTLRYFPSAQPAENRAAAVEALALEYSETADKRADDLF